MKKIVKFFTLALVVFSTLIFIDSISRIHEPEEDDESDSDPFGSPDSIFLD